MSFENLILRSSGTLPTRIRTVEDSRRGELDQSTDSAVGFENLILRSSGGIGRRVGLKIQSGFTLGASSSLAWSNKIKELSINVESSFFIAKKASVK